MEKTLYCIRHGYSYHNKLFWDIGRRAYVEFRDTPLLEKGFCEAKLLNKTWQELPKIELVLVSPLTRTLQTAEFIFRNRNIPMIAKDFLLDFPLGGDELCNYRKEIDDLRYIYPYVNFEIMDNKYNWKPNRETVLDLNNRIEDMLSWIGNRREQHIAIVSHSSYLGQFKDRKIGDETNELKHCFPYKLKTRFDSNKNFVSMKEVTND